jgi:hypothetical protein
VARQQMCLSTLSARMASARTKGWKVIKKTSRSVLLPPLSAPSRASYPGGWFRVQVGGGTGKHSIEKKVCQNSAPQGVQVWAEEEKEGGHFVPTPEDKGEVLCGDSAEETEPLVCRLDFRNSIRMARVQNKKMVVTFFLQSQGRANKKIKKGQGRTQTIARTKMRVPGLFGFGGGHSRTRCRSVKGMKKLLFLTPLSPPNFIRSRIPLRTRS